LPLALNSLKLENWTYLLAICELDLHFWLYVKWIVIG